MAQLWAALAALVTGVLGLVGGYAAALYKTKERREERFTEREKNFETAQTGYRACYRKLLVNIAACHAEAKGIPLKDQEKADMTTLLSNFWEASFTGDPEVIRELDEYWPQEDRANGNLPDQSPPLTLLEAMRLHGSRRLEDQDRIQEGFLPTAA